MSFLFSVFTFMALVLLVDASPAPELDLGRNLMPQVRRNSSSLGGRSDMVEAVKRHILNMLHLSARPNLTQPVPRAALLNAIRKLQVGQVSADGSVEIKEDEDKMATPPEPPSEVITFAQAGPSVDSVTFDLMRDSDGAQVEQANVWIFLRVMKMSRLRGKVMLHLHHEEDEGGPLVSEKMLDTRRSGWHSFPVSRSIQTLMDAGIFSLRLRVSCPLCADAGCSPVLAPDGQRGGDQSHRPFLMVALQAREETVQRRVKRGLECDGKIRVCCKRQFYVNFRDIGWNDWIIAPSGYHANYCEGDCPGNMASGGSALSFHSTVIGHYRMRGYGPFQSMKSCCVPTRLRAMSMLYYDDEQKIIKKDIEDMIVDECGCS